MAKTLTMADTGNMPLNGKWVWKEESHSLEYISHKPSSDKHDKKRDRRQQKGHHDDNRGRTSPSQLARAAPFGGGRGGKGGKGFGERARSAKHSHVTLEDVKSVAFEMLSGQENIAFNFTGLFEADQFDQFLLCLLNYFHWYFEKKAHEEKPNPMNIEPSLREKKYYADLCTKIETAQKVLGQSYCILVLGIGMETQHHMKGGTSRVSNTYQDRSMYESLYSFCTFLVWVAFRRKDYENVKKELNRILRSHTFNPAIRIKNAPEEKPQAAAEKKTEEGAEEEKEKEKKEEKKLTPAEYRRQQGRRPPIKNIINQRSPALVSILPSPKEEAHWLFRRTGALSPSKSNTAFPGTSRPQEMSLAEIGREDISQEDRSKYEHLDVDVAKLHVGIIGEPLNLFHPITLTPKGTDQEGEEEDEDGEQKTKDGRRGSQTLRTPGSQDRRPSREATAVSQVTQEGLPDD